MEGKIRLIFYHGTSESNAKKIEKEGFVPDKKYNWKIKSKRGFVYLSIAYAPFYAMNHNTRKLALIKVEVKEEDLYPDDDFIMGALGKPKYTQKELDKVNLDNFKCFWKDSLKHMGNVAVKPEKVKILGVKYFDRKHLIMKCDPVIAPINFFVMGDYYRELSEWIFQGNDILEFRNFCEPISINKFKEVKKWKN